MFWNIFQVFLIIFAAITHTLIRATQRCRTCGYRWQVDDLTSDLSLGCNNFHSCVCVMRIAIILNNRDRFQSAETFLRFVLKSYRLTHTCHRFLQKMGPIKFQIALYTSINKFSCSNKWFGFRKGFRQIRVFCGLKADSRTTGFPIVFQQLRSNIVLENLNYCY